MFERPKPTDRVLCAGPTGCGKTVFMNEFLLLDYTDVCKVDFKHDIKMKKGDLLATNLRELERQLNKARDQGATVVYHVPKEHLLPQNASQLDMVAKMMLDRADKRCPSILYYDELVYVAGAADFWKRAPHYYFAVTTGRGRGLGVYACVQRPAYIPMVALSESDLRITFYLRKRADQERLEELLGEDIPWGALRKRKHTFVYGNDMETFAPQILKLTA